MAWQFKFTGDQLARFIPATGVALVAFDQARGTGHELVLVEHFEDEATAEAALLSVVDLPCFLSFALPARGKQLDLFGGEPTSSKAQHGSGLRGRATGASDGRR